MQANPRRLSSQPGAVSRVKSAPIVFQDMEEKGYLRSLLPESGVLTQSSGPKKTEVNRAQAVYTPGVRYTPD